eukprot:jgi/Phyca11/21815/fgenesh1_pg.PHYCAscaffold_129_\
MIPMDRVLMINVSAVHHGGLTSERADSNLIRTAMTLVVTGPVTTTTTRVRKSAASGHEVSLGEANTGGKAAHDADVECGVSNVNNLDGNERSSSISGDTKKSRTKRTREDSGDENHQEKAESRKRKNQSKSTVDTERKTVAQVGAVRQQTDAEQTQRDDDRYEDTSGDEMKVGGSDDEDLTTVDLTTRTVVVGKTRVLDWMDEMQYDAEQRDEEQAAVFPETNEKTCDADDRPDWCEKPRECLELGKAQNSLNLGEGATVVGGTVVGNEDGGTSDMGDTVRSAATEEGDVTEGAVKNGEDSRE